MIRIARLLLIIPLIGYTLNGCSGNKPGKKQEEQKATTEASVAAPVVGQETMLLLKDLEENGDYVNSQFFPSLIKASVVYEELGVNNLDH